MTAVAYSEFLADKVAVAQSKGVECRPDQCHEILKPHQKDIVAWAVSGGRRAIFTAFGLGKTLIQLETVRLAMDLGGEEYGLITIPLGVRHEFMRDAELVGAQITFVKSDAEIGGPGIYLTNYESVREGKVTVERFGVVTLDEAACLRGFGGTKTFREFMAVMAGDDRRDMGNRVVTDGVRFRFVATAMPSPNDYVEILAYAAFLGVMDVGQAKTRFFKRDSQRADNLTLHPHKESEFWHWVSSWAVFVQRPSDLGYSDEGYDMPPLDVRWHEVATDHQRARAEGDQSVMFNDASLGVVEASREKRASIEARVAKLLRLRAEDLSAHRVVWHDLEDERLALEQAVPTMATVYGSQPLDEREDLIIKFSDGQIQELATKPVIAGSGCNLQRHCHWAVFLGIGFKFNDFFQAIHRLQRFQQQHAVRVDIIYTEAERGTRETLVRKWRQHEDLVAKMTEIIKRYGLATSAWSQEMARSMGVQRQEASGNGWRMVNQDSVVETEAIESDSVGLVLTSIPFGTQYEYSPNYADFGHTDDNQHFWRQMDYLTPGLLRVLMPGRIAAVHVKDRITPGGITGLGFQTVQPFHAQAIDHYIGHGFAYMGMVTIVTDVVRENAQTYRLGWSEQCKDATKMGVGMPEYLLLFRKPPTDNARSYADLPVVKSKDDYSRGRWQFDAHGFHRSNGDRPLTTADLEGLKHDEVFQLFKRWSLDTVYDHEATVALAEYLDAKKMLPPSFMLLQPQSWHEDCWTDIVRMRSLNGAQYAAGREQHICPLPFDICDRTIARFTNPGELVYDPFAGLGTVPLCAVKAGRQGLGCELSPSYFADAVFHLKRNETEGRQMTIFDLLGEPEA